MLHRNFSVVHAYYYHSLVIVIIKSVVQVYKRHGVEATSCQAERNYSSLSFLIGTLRASMSPFEVEQIMLLKLNQGCLPEVQKYNAVIAAQQERRSQCLQDVQSAQNSRLCELRIDYLIEDG